jgi:uncharacterized delta-60 repeat protein
MLNMKKVFKQTLMAIIVSLFGIKAYSQIPGTRDFSFDMGTGFNDFQYLVYDIKIFPNDKILIGGGFHSYNGEQQNHLILLNPNGSKATEFNIGDGFNNSGVISLAVQSDGKILVGGAFSEFNGETHSKLVRLNPDGSLDDTFNIGLGFNERINSIVVQPNGKILVGGFFTEFNGQPQNRLVRLNIDGTKDNSFNIGIGFDDVVISLVAQSDGKVIVGGRFSFFNGQSQNKLTRLNTDGSIDDFIEIGGGLNYDVFALELQSDGKIIVGGDFSLFNSVNCSAGLVRLNMDGSIDNEFNSNGNGFDNWVHSIDLQPDGKIIVGGNFNTYNNQPRYKLARLNYDGSLDDAFEQTGFDDAVRVVEMQSDGKILVGGYFRYFSSELVNHIIRLYGNDEMANTNELDTFSLKIYPNPVKERFLLNVPTKKVTVFDISGRKVIEENNTSSYIGVSHLLKGVYLVEAVTVDGVFKVKMIKR